VPKDVERIWDTLRDEFFSFFPKNMDGEGIWNTLEMLMGKEPRGGSKQPIRIGLVPLLTSLLISIVYNIQPVRPANP
jgi:hypothetical protein